MGTPQIAADTLETLLEGNDPIVGVVTQPDQPAGRGQRSAPSPVRAVAERHGIPVLAAPRIKTPEFLNKLESWHPEVLVVVAYGRILPKTILELPPHGCVNVHYSLLPKCRGAAPAAWTIIRGESEGGVTIMKLVEKMDAGPVYLQEAVPLTPDETAGSLQAKLAPVGARLLMQALQGLKEGTLTARNQDESLATFAPMLKKEDGWIDWTRPAVEIERWVRGLHPWPGSFTLARGKLLKVHRVKAISAPSLAGAPGEVVRADGKGFWVATASGIIQLDEVQWENRKKIPGTEFIKGARIKIGDRLA